mmetsp:Transcript_86979/g.246588  ORF Transcript_86979/g.246588 Transcript_86979/m.246588 type:complete len:480 (+) Transcript_86979:181-1620(+)
MADAPMQVMDVGGILVYQLLCGRDIANPKLAPDPQVAKLFGFARDMRNFVYLVVDPKSREGLVLDAAWDTEGVFRYAEGLGVSITAALYTHSHFDHAGGHVPPSMTGGIPVCLPGAQDFVERQVPVWAGAGDLAAIAEQCRVPEGALSTLGEGESLAVGRVRCTAFHTPGHTPGSLCLFVPCGGSGAAGGEALGASGCERVPACQGALLSGDTLFVQSCGRTDLPGSDQMEMFRSLSRLAQGLPDECVVCPGHDYAPVPHTTIGEERSTNQMVGFGLRQWSTPGALPEYRRCTCVGRFRDAAGQAFAKPDLTILALSGGKLALDGVPLSRANGASLKMLLLKHIQSSTDASVKARRPKSTAELTLSDGGGNHQLRDDDSLMNPAFAVDGLALFGAELPGGSARRSWFQHGDKVVLEGLKGAAELNGLLAEVQSWIPAKGRYEVALADSGAVKSVKADNLITPVPYMSVPPPPVAVPDVD